jgi:hypothetical protein
MRPDPAHKLGYISRQLNSLTVGAELNPFEVNGWKNTVFSIESWQEDALAQSVLSVIATIEGDENEFRNRSQDAERLSPGSYELFMSRGASLMWFGHLRESSEAHKSAWERCPQSKGATSEYIKSLLRVGQFQECVKILSHWNQISPDSASPFSSVSTISSYIDRLGIEDNDVTRLVEKASECAKLSKGGLRSVITLLKEDDEDAWVSIRLKLVKPVLEVRQIEKQWFSWIAEAGINTLLDEKILIGFSPAKPPQ